MLGNNIVNIDNVIRIEMVISAKVAFNVKATEQVQEPQGREGGLAPALIRW